MPRWLAGVGVAALVIASLGVLAVSEPPAEPVRDATGTLSGQVVDPAGAPVPGAHLVWADGRTTTADDGRFLTGVQDGARVVTVTAPGHLPRAQAVAPGVPARIGLAGDDGVSLRFAGDTMFGRRFLDTDAPTRRALTSPGGTPEEVTALLSHVEPLLSDADIAVVNLETPLVADPSFDPEGPRPAWLHPTKDIAFATGVAAAQALADTGVDLVSLGNNHAYDALDAGLASTVEALDRAGVAHVGAGATEEEAWAPAVVQVRGAAVAFVACTSVTGRDEEPAYVAGPGQGGAAACEPERLARAVQEAGALAGDVVVMVHGGSEYQQTPTPGVERLVAAATAAGADLVVNGHPHVLGGVRESGGALVADSTGNLVFDQQLWPTFLSAVLRADLSPGAPPRIGVDPLLLEDYVPRPSVGGVADAAARRAAGLPGTPMRLQGPGAVSAPSSAPSTSLERLDPGTPVRLARGWWVRDAPATGRVRVGTDLLWTTGSFEDADTDPATSGAHLWSLGLNASRTADDACTGEAGVGLRRGPLSTRDVVVTPSHRQIVEPGAELSLLVGVHEASSGGVVELRWYSGAEGASSGLVSAPVPPTRGEGCRLVRLDATVPDDAVAVQPVVRLSPPAGIHLVLRLGVDDVRLVQWAPAGASGRAFDTVEVVGKRPADVELAADAGADAAAGPFEDGGPT